MLKSRKNSYKIKMPDTTQEEGLGTSSKAAEASATHQQTFVIETTTLVRATRQQVFAATWLGCHVALPLQHRAEFLRGPCCSNSAVVFLTSKQMRFIYLRVKMVLIANIVKLYKWFHGTHYDNDINVYANNITNHILTVIKE